MASHPYIKYPHAAKPASLTPRQVADAYNFPTAQATGRGAIIGIIELGGGYSPTQVSKYFTDNDLPVPSFVSINVDGGANKSDGPNGADGEVQLDMIVPGAIAPNAAYRIYFAPNTDAGFAQALQQATTECSVVTISWGGPENQWSSTAITTMSNLITAARERGIPVFIAAGDSGSKDSTGANVTDFPASAPDAIGCGGTRLTVDTSGARAAEVVWDDDDAQSATGGGESKVFPGRGVPDIAGNADPNTGYEIYIDGKPYVIGGTSAVAPLMAGLYALLFELNQGKAFDVLNLIVTNPSVCFDVTSGDNGGFRAGPGRDETTGFGVPDGAKLWAALQAAEASLPTPPPVTAPPTSGADPYADFPIAAFDKLLAAKHNYTATESRAVTDLEAWIEKVGIKE